MLILYLDWTQPESNLLHSHSHILRLVERSPRIEFVKVFYVIFIKLASLMFCELLYVFSVEMGNIELCKCTHLLSTKMSDVKILYLFARI